MHSVVRPVFTEKSLQDAEKGKFTFIVVLSATKDDIKKDVEETYKVHVVDIATVIVNGKVKRVGKKRTEKTLGKYKKALVKLKNGEKIDAFALGEKK